MLFRSRAGQPSKQGQNAGQAQQQQRRPQRQGGNANARQASKPQAPKDGNFNREGASFAEKSKPQDGFWQKLSKGRLFSR